MKGYVKNVSSEWAYAMKRSVRPGGEVPLEELFEQYGKKYDMAPGDEFIDWLQNTKLRNTNRWKIVFDFGDGAGPVSTEPVREKVVPSDRPEYSTPLVSKKMEIADVINLPVRKAREVMPRITDLSLLKYSLAEARQLADKDSLCRIIHKRIKELQISR